jgi:hypothetical protein
MGNRCKALTASGEPCKNTALEGSEFCAVHNKGQAHPRVDERDEVAPPPEDAPETGDPLPPQAPSEQGQLGEDAPEAPPPPDAPDVAGEEENDAPPPPHPPAVGEDRPDQDYEEIVAEARAARPAPQEDSARETVELTRDDFTVARQDRGRPEVQAPLTTSGRTERRKAYLLEELRLGTITDEEFQELADLRGPSAFRQAMPTTDLPPAPRKRDDGSVDAYPGQTEGTTSGQSEARVFFKSEGATELKQTLPDGRVAEFHGSIYSTTDPDIIRMMRARIDKGGALYDEDDPALFYRCPLCDFGATSKGVVNRHIRQEHPEREDAQL